MFWKNSGDPGDRRRRALTVSTLILVTTGVSVISAVSEHGDQWRSVDVVKTVSLLILALMIALAATTRFSARWHAPELNDELTMANRASAAVWGYWALMLALVGLALVNMRWPVPVSEALPLLIGFGAAIAGIRFVMLERRGT